MSSPLSSVRLGVSTLALQTSWTDDLPVCENSAVGYETNKAYRRDGYRTEEHLLEDFSFHFELDRGLCLYAVFDGFQGSEAARFSQQRMPAELCFGQLSRADSSEASVRSALQQAFCAVENGFFESIGSALAERAMLLSELPAGVNEFLVRSAEEISCGDVQMGESIGRLVELNSVAACGTCAVIAVVFDRRLFVANAGDSRALLCSTRPDGILHVQQLSTDHRLDKNSSEQKRLHSLGVDVDSLQQFDCHVQQLHGGCSPVSPRDYNCLAEKEGSAERTSQMITRCLGNYFIKNGFRENPKMATASSEPALYSPEITVTELDDTHRFLLLVSGGLYRALDETALDTSDAHVNRRLSQLVVEQFAVQTTLDGVAQSVVNRVARDHHDSFINSHNQRCLRCEDMTLLVRNFNYPLRNCSANSGGINQFSAQSIRCDYLTVTDSDTLSLSRYSSVDSSQPTDSNECIPAYVNFDAFNANMAQAGGELADDSWWKKLLNI